MKWHNLLDTIAKKSLIREYYSRLAIVASLLFALAMLLGLLALVPTYAYLSTELQVSARDDIQAETPEATSTPARELLASGAAELKLFSAQFNEAPVSELIRDAFAVRPEGVIVTGVSYERSSYMLTIAGVAQSRNALVTYSRNLEAHGRFSSVQLPISDLAKNVNLPFRISFIVALERTP